MLEMVIKYNIYIRKIAQVLLSLLITIFLIISLYPIQYNNNKKIFNNLKFNTHIKQYCLLGARVYPHDKLSPVLKQRCDSFIYLYNTKRYMVDKLIISGSGSYEVDNIYNYLVKHSINSEIIIKDYEGFSTGKTIEYLVNNNYKEIIFITQTFHLYRTIEMAHTSKIDSYGLASEKIFPYQEDLNLFRKLSIKIKRYYTSSLKLVFHKLGIYNKYAKY